MPSNNTYPVFFYTYTKTTAGRRFLAKRLRHFKTDAAWHQGK